MLTADVIGAALRLTNYLAIFALVGATAAALQWTTDLGAATVRLRARALWYALLAGGVLTVATLANLYTQTWLFFGADEGVNPETLRIIAMDTGWGAGWRVQFAAATFALAGAALASRGDRVGWPTLAVGALAAAGTQALTGHAVEMSWLNPAVASQTVHVAAGALWIGSLAIVTLVVVRRETDGELIAAVVGRFSPLAVVSVAALTIAGGASAYLYLDSPSDLWITVYGRVLSAKVVAFGCAAAVGYHNWKTIRPRLPQPSAVTELRRAVTAELALAIIVLALTAFLVALPLPASGM
jgi:putative copper export protein